MGSRVLFVMPLLLVSACFAREAGAAKPECNAQTKGDFWPDKANRGSGVPVEMCVEKHWKYRWEQLTVDISQLRRKHQTVATAAEKTPGENKPVHTPVNAE